MQKRHVKKSSCCWPQTCWSLSERVSVQEKSLNCPCNWGQEPGGLWSSEGLLLPAAPAPITSCSHSLSLPSCGSGSDSGFVLKPAAVTALPPLHTKHDYWGESRGMWAKAAGRSDTEAFTFHTLRSFCRGPQQPPISDQDSVDPQDLWWRQSALSWEVVSRQAASAELSNFKNHTDCTDRKSFNMWRKILFSVCSVWPFREDSGLSESRKWRLRRAHSDVAERSGQTHISHYVARLPALREGGRGCSLIYLRLRQTAKRIRKIQTLETFCEN